jgi:hypothetical protein
MPWQPTTIKRPDRSYNTGAEAVRVTTDAGSGFLKALGNRGGPHLLAAELVGTHLAKWLGLPTFDFTIIQVTDLDEIQFARGGIAKPGPAFITREQSGMVWDGTEDALRSLVNPEDIGKLVLFDTWTRNCDRHPPDLNHRKVNRNNVFLSNEGMSDGQFQLIAMDHTHCFDCGRDLNATLAHIDKERDDRLFGLFPEFKRFIPPHFPALQAAVAKLQALDRKMLHEVVAGIPAQWEVSLTGCNALETFIANRADYMADSFVAFLEKQLGV